MALNMHDELTKMGAELDFDQFGQLLGIPVVPTTAYKGVGIKELFEKVIEIYEEKERTFRHIHISYGEDIESSLNKIQSEIWKNPTITDKVSSRLLAIQLLEKDKGVHRFLSGFSEYAAIKEVADHEIEKLEKQFHEDTATLSSEARYGFIAGALKETYTEKQNKEPRSYSDKIDRVLTHKVYGYPIFLGFLWLVFQSTFSFGKYPVAWIEAAVSALGAGLGSIIPAGLFNDLIINGIIGGTGSVLVFLPNILILFFFIAIMEDTGYMARVAFIMDKLMHRLGLHGKSFIPLIIGFGCNVPAILATRTIENRKDRLLTMLIIPFMSCSARLPVYILLISAFFPSYPVLALFILYLMGIALAIFFSALFNKVIFKTGQTPFVMELPPYRVPTLRSVVKHMWFRGVMYLRKVGGVILVASIAIWMLQYFPQSPDYSRNYTGEIESVRHNYTERITSTPDKVAQNRLTTDMNQAISQIEAAKGSERMEKSYLGQLGKLISPAFAPLGFDWKIGVSLISGIAAKEIVLSTMGVIFQDPTGDNSGTHLQTELQHHFAKINDAPAFVTASSLLVFILIYFPCLGVVSAIGRESGSWKWATFTVFYTTALAWLASFVVFQAGKTIF
jgi:ferrous iron transport protein B